MKHLLASQLLLVALGLSACGGGNEIQPSAPLYMSPVVTGGGCEVDSGVRLAVWFEDAQTGMGVRDAHLTLVRPSDGAVFERDGTYKAEVQNIRASSQVLFSRGELPEGTYALTSSAPGYEAKTLTDVAVASTPNAECPPLATLVTVRMTALPSTEPS